MEVIKSNPADSTKVTFVSVVPREIRLPQPHINPSMYVIPAAKNGPEILIIGEATHFVYMGEGRQLQQTEPAYKIADALINQYVNSQLCIGEDTAPGVFWVPGVNNKEDIKKKHQEQLSRAYAVQKNWFTALVREADDVWTKFHQHKSISELQREACKALDLKRDWMIVPADENVKKCPACGSAILLDTAFVCATCHYIINPLLAEQAKKQGMVPVGA